VCVVPGKPGFNSPIRSSIMRDSFDHSVGGWLFFGQIPAITPCLLPSQAT
jgi:hypothetical protein